MVQHPITEIDSTIGVIFAGSVYGVILFFLSCIGCCCLIIILLRCCLKKKYSEKKKRLKNDSISCAIYVAVHFGFLIFSAVFMMYMLISPRQCTESVCLSEMEMIANDLFSSAEVVVSKLKHIERSRQKECEEKDGNVDTCQNLPPDHESGCIFRIGQDTGCGCFGRQIWASNTSWLNKPKYDDWKYCINDGRLAEILEETFDEISNKDILVRNIFLSFNSSDHLVYPSRKIGSLFIPVPFMSELHLGDECMMNVGENFTSTLCLKNYDPVIQPFFTASLERKPENFVVVYDVNPFPDPEKISNQTQFESLQIILENILVHNDLVLPIPFGKDKKEVVRPDRIYHLSHENKHSIYEIINSYVTNKKGTNEVKFESVMEIAVDENGKKGIYPSAVYIVFVHSPPSDQLKDVLKKVYKIIPSIFIIFGAEEETVTDFWDPYCHSLKNNTHYNWYADYYHRRSGCMFIPDAESFSRKNFTEYIQDEFIESYLSVPDNWYGDDGRIFVMPFQDEVENQNVVSVTIPITQFRQSEGEYIIYGMNVDWPQMKNYYCSDETNLYPILWRLEDVGVYIASITNTVSFMVYIGYVLYVFLFPFVEKFFRFADEEEEDMMRGSVWVRCFLSCADMLHLFYSLNHIWLVIIMGLLIAIMIPTFWSNIIIVGLLFTLLWVVYLTLCCCGVCGLQLKVYSVQFPAKKKRRKRRKVEDEKKIQKEEEYEEIKDEEEEEEDDVKMSRSKKIEMKGMKMVIERIEFDSFIKGSFRNIVVESGKVSGIIGHSGAGKSTFFNILLGVHSPKAMRVLISSPSHQVVVNSLTEISEFVGLVPQEEILTQRLTVFEQLLVQAKSKYSNQESDIIRYWSEQLGMGGALYTKYPNELSGGQAKRLSCLRELVGISPIILLDEPTSGLDGQSAEELIMSLSKLAKSQGLAIVVILHQPSTSILSYFDHLYIFLKEKETVESAEIPLEGVTADHLDEFLKEPDRHKEKRDLKVFDESSEFLLSKSNDVELKRMVFYELFSEIKKRRVWCFIKFLYIFYASCLEGLRDVQGILIDILVICGSAVALIAIFNPIHPFQGKSSSEIELCLQQACGDVQRESLECSSNSVMQNCSYPKFNPLYLQIFMTMFSVGLISLITSLRLFGEEKKNMKRLFRSGVNFFQYYLSRLIVHVPRMLVSVYLFLSLFYNTTCLVAPFWYYYIICMILYVLVTGQGVVCSLLFPTKEKAVESTLLGMILISSSLLFSGIIVTKSQISDDPVKREFYSIFSFFKYFSYAFYGNEFLYVREIMEYKSITPMSVKESIEMYGYSYKHSVLFGHLCVILLETVLWYALGLAILFFVYTQNPWSKVNKLLKNCCCCCGLGICVLRSFSFGNDLHQQQQRQIRQKQKQKQEEEEEEGIINIDKYDLVEKREEDGEEEEGEGEEEEEEEERERLIDINDRNDILLDLKEKKKDEDYNKYNVMIFKEEERKKGRRRVVQEEEEIIIQENINNIEEEEEEEEGIETYEAELTKEEMEIVEKKMILGVSTSSSSSSEDEKEDQGRKEIDCNQSIHRFGDVDDSSDDEVIDLDLLEKKFSGDVTTRRSDDPF